MHSKEAIKDKLKELGYWFDENGCYDKNNNYKKYSIGFIGSVSIKNTFSSINEIEEWIKSRNELKEIN